MAYYYLNHDKQPNGDNEVHKSPCSTVDSFLPDNFEYLGEYDNCSDAVSEARKRHLYWRINGCWHCSRPCHTT